MDMLSIIVISVLFVILLWGAIGLAITDRFVKLHGRSPGWRDFPWWVWIFTGACLCHIFGKRASSNNSSLSKEGDSGSVNEGQDTGGTNGTSPS